MNDKQKDLYIAFKSDNKIMKTQPTKYKDAAVWN